MSNEAQQITEALALPALLALPAPDGERRLDALRRVHECLARLENLAEPLPSRCRAAAEPLPSRCRAAAEPLHRFAAGGRPMAMPGDSGRGSTASPG